MTIVRLAVTLNRLPEHGPPSPCWVQRHRLLVTWLARCAPAVALAQFFPYFLGVERKQALSVAKPIDALMDQVIRLIAPVTAWLRCPFITWVLIPSGTPIWDCRSPPSCRCWPPSVGRLAALWSAAVCVAHFRLIALSGWWDPAMITVYMVSISVAIAVLIGLPLGIWAARNAARVVLVCDTAQTFPSITHLIPRLPMALPTMRVAANPSVIFSLFMVIIAALIGTQDLGQEMQRALSSTDAGKGLVLDPAVACMGG